MVVMDIVVPLFDFVTCLRLVVVVDFAFLGMILFGDTSNYSVNI